MVLDMVNHVYLSSSHIRISFIICNYRPDDYYKKKFNNLFRTKDTFQTYSLDTNRYVLTDLRKHLTSCHILVKYMEHLIIKSNTRKYLFIRNTRNSL